MAQQLITPKTSTLSSAEFFRRIDAIQPGVAVFDCDGTLWSGDAGVGFMQWSMGSGLLSREACNWMDTRYRAYLRGEVSELAICGEMVQIYRDLRETELRQAAHTYFDTVTRPNIFPEMSAVCRQLQARGTTLWAVSSTNSWLIEDAMQHFGIPAERVLAARVRVTHELITEELLDIPTDEGKVQSLARVGVLQPDAVFGNSIHDAAMLTIAKHPFVVNPTAELTEIAALQGWPIFQPGPVHA
ncbi:MAG: HAD family hydrolase [Acidobacteriaceae bacterium]